MNSEQRRIIECFECPENEHRFQSSDDQQPDFCFALGLETVLAS